LAAATGTQDVVSIKVALMSHLLAQLHKITDLLIPLTHVSLQHLQVLLFNFRGLQTIEKLTAKPQLILTYCKYPSQIQRLKHCGHMEWEDQDNEGRLQNRVAVLHGWLLF
jgi:hypothetical protein